MLLISRYLFKKMILIIALLTVIFIGAIWLTQSLRFIEVIVNHSVSLWGYFSLIIYLIPDLMATTLPICLLIGGIHVYSKLTNDHEIQVIKALGLSNYQTAKPLLVLGLLTTGLVFFINIYVMPLSFQKFRNQEHQIRNQFSGSLIREGTFNMIKGITAYVRERGEQGELYGILIYKPQGQKVGNEESTSFISHTIIAEKGSLYQTEDGPILVLKNGSRQEKDSITGKISFFNFWEFTLDLSKTIKQESERVTKPYEKSLTELFNQNSTDDQHLKARMRVEGHQRLLTPWFSLIDVLIVSTCMLMGDFGRKGRKYRILAGIIFSLVLHLVIHVLFSISVQRPFLITCAYLFIVITIIGLSISLEWKRISFFFSKRKNSL